MTIRHKDQQTAKTPRDLYGWVKLAQLAIARAEKIKDRRLEGLRASLTNGKAERTLRQLGIICEADVDREFPNPT
jgi:ABC-type microcin C transport system permease subunit YejE